LRCNTRIACGPAAKDSNLAGEAHHQMETIPEKETLWHLDAREEKPTLN
jgi:hypothetical protein